MRPRPATCIFRVITNLLCPAPSGPGDRVSGAVGGQDEKRRREVIGGSSGNHERARGLVSGMLSLALVAVATLAASADAKIDYPAARKADVVQDYFGTRVADPYRWLEDADLPETAKWVEANNAI